MQCVWFRLNVIRVALIGFGMALQYYDNHHLYDVQRILYHCSFCNYHY